MNLEERNKVFVGNGFDKGSYIKITINIDRLKLKKNYATLLVAKRDTIGKFGETHNIFYFNKKDEN